MGEEPERAGHPQKPPGRSRRMLVMWTLALGILLALGVFCRLVVMPVYGSTVFVFLTMSQADSTAEEVRALHEAGKKQEAAAARRKAVKLYLQVAKYYLMLPVKSPFREDGLYHAGEAHYLILVELAHKEASPAEKVQAKESTLKAIQHFEAYRKWISEHPARSPLDDPDLTKSGAAHVRRLRERRSRTIGLYLPFLYLERGNLSEARRSAAAQLAKGDSDVIAQACLRGLLVRVNLKLAEAAPDAAARAAGVLEAAKELRDLRKMPRSNVEDAEQKRRLEAMAERGLEDLAKALGAPPERQKVETILKQSADGRWLLEEISAAVKMHE